VRQLQPAIHRSTAFLPDLSQPIGPHEILPASRVTTRPTLPRIAALASGSVAPLPTDRRADDLVRRDDFPGAGDLGGDKPEPSGSDRRAIFSPPRRTVAKRPQFARGSRRGEEYRPLGPRYGCIVLG
jgi:hypothetical protein